MPVEKKEKLVGRKQKQQNQKNRETGAHGKHVKPTSDTPTVFYTKVQNLCLSSRAILPRQTRGSFLGKKKLTKNEGSVIAMRKS